MAKQTETITKVYKARTEYSVTVVCPTCGRIHIHFDGMNDGQSMYMTDNKEIQDALESIPTYGKVFTMEAVQTQPKTETVIETTVEEKTVTIPVSGIAEAKEYLCEHYDYTRTSLRTKTAIQAAAKEHNIEFVGI